MKHVNQRKYSYIPYPQLMDEPDNPYGKKASVRGGGCGLCSACMIVDQLTTQTLPVRECAELSMKIGANHCDGTDMKMLGPAIAEKYNLDFSMVKDIGQVVKALHNGARVIALVSAKGPTNKGIFTQGGHYIVLISADEDDEICVLDPSWTSKKFNKWVKKGLVRTEDTLVYIKPEVLDAERKNESVDYFVFRRKK